MLDKIDWGAIWLVVWPIVKQGLIALLVAILSLLGYDAYVPSRYVRRDQSKRSG